MQDLTEIVDTQSVSNVKLSKSRTAHKVTLNENEVKNLVKSALDEKSIQYKSVRIMEMHKNESSSHQHVNEKELVSGTVEVEDEDREYFKCHFGIYCAGRGNGGESSYYYDSVEVDIDVRERR